MGKEEKHFFSVWHTFCNFLLFEKFFKSAGFKERENNFKNQF